MAKKKTEELKTLEKTATNAEGGFDLEITEKDIQNFPELGDNGVQKGDKIFIPDEYILGYDEPDQITNDFISQDEDSLLESYVKELLVSLEGVFIGGVASQKRDQLISYLYRENIGDI